MLFYLLLLFVFFQYMLKHHSFIYSYKIIHLYLQRKKFIEKQFYYLQKFQLTFKSLTLYKTKEENSLNIYFNYF